MTLPRIVTELDAANAALSLIGEGALTSLDESRTAARAVRRHFGTIRDTLLKKTDWNFAAGQVDMIAADLTPTTPFLARYVLPADCLKVRNCEGLAEGDWSVVGTAADDDPVVTYLDASVTAVTVNYTRRVTQPLRWSPDFTVVFVAALADAIAPQISRVAGIGSRAQQAREELAEAKRTDAREAAPKTVSRDTSWIRSRR